MFERSSELIFKKIFLHKKNNPDQDLVRKLIFLQPLRDPAESYMEFCTKRIRMVMISLSAGLLLFLMMKLSLLTGSSIPDEGIERDEWNGKKQRIELYAIADGERLETDIILQPRRLSEEELDEYSQDFLNNVSVLISGNNTDLMKVNTDLVLSERYEGYPFTFSWKSSDPGLVSAFGGRVDPSSGEGDVVLTVEYSYGEYSNEAEIRVRVVSPDMSASEALESRIAESLRESENAERDKKLWHLPSSIDGKVISWELRKEDKSSMILGLFAVVSILIYAAASKDLNTKIENRKKSMKRSYPKVLRQISLYTGAGMTVKGAFMKMASDSEASGSNEPIYEEIRSACNEMGHGLGEAECYERFGRRTGLGEYIKLAGSLSQNLRRGNADFITGLKNEAEMAMKERILESKKSGEEAQTKLLAPMMMMLAVVMVMIMIPAFTGMNI